MDDDSRRLELSSSLRQLCHPDLEPLFWLPDRRGSFSAWWGHVPFAHWIMRATKPRVFVELGTHYGVSYAAFCQAVVRCELGTRCYAVDTWKGDEHASFYDESVYEDLRGFHDAHYAAFSTLLRYTFDEALDHIADGSVDLMHIDGLHTYEAVGHDFENWLPKLSRRGVVLFHDIGVHRDDFGVWRLWRELAEHYPHFEFDHCYGLGVLGVGEEIPDAVAELCAIDGTKDGAALRSRVASLGDRWISEAREQGAREALNEEQRRRAAIEAAHASLNAQAEALRGQLVEVRRETADQDKLLSELRKQLEKLQQQIANADRENLQLRNETRVLRDAIGELHGSIDQSTQRLQSIEESTIWRASAILRSMAARLPPPFRLQLRRVAKAGYWLLTPHRMPARLRFLRDRRRARSRPGGEVPRREEKPGSRQHARTSADRKSTLVLRDMPDPEPPLRSEPVDIIVCVHNALDDVRQCLHSLVERTQPPYRVIIVDDGSDAPTRDYLSDFAAVNNAVLLRNEQALGYTRAANCGLRVSDAPWVVLLNSDTIVTEPWLDAMWRNGWRDGEIGIIGPLSNSASWQSVPRIAEDGDWSKNPLPPGMTAQDMADAARKAAVGARTMPFLNGFCYMIRRSVIDRIGLFDEETFGAGYGEENDYSIRARRAGYKLAVATDAYVFHAGSKSYSTERRRMLERRADEALAAKHNARVHIEPYVNYCASSLVFASVRARIGAAVRRHQLSQLGRQSFAGKHVAFVLPVAEYGGGLNVVLQEARALQSMGVGVSILNFSALHQKLTKHGAPEGLRFVTFEDEASLRGHLEQIPVEYDAVVATYFASVYWLPRQSGSGCAFGYYIQDFEPRFFAETDHNHSIALASYAWSNELKLFTKTLWNQRAVADATGRIPTVIGPSVNVDLFMPSEERALPPADRPLRVAAMLRPASRYRAAPRTVAVLEEVIRDRGRLEVHAFGTSDDLLAEQGLTRGWITNHGHLAPRKLAALLGQCDIFVDFSDYQAMGLTLLEAMASGCAVIGPREGGATSFLRDGVNALVADTASNEDCIKQASRLVDDATLRTNLQRRAIDDANLHVPEAAALNMLMALFGGA